MKGYVDQLNGYLAAAGRDRKQFGIDPWISIAGLDKDDWRRRVEAWPGSHPPGRGYDARRLRHAESAHRRDPVLP